MKLAVVIAAYDERENIVPLARRLAAILSSMAADAAAEGWEHELIFVVEGRDGTREALLELRGEVPSLRILYQPEPSGLGAAFRRGFAAVSPDADFVITLDADLNHQPEEIPRLVASLASSGADILVGSRWMAGASVLGTPLWKLALSRIVGFAMTHLFGLSVRDKTSGFRVYRRAALLELPFERDNFAFLPEILLLAGRAGLSIREEPIRFVYRVEGKSKMGLLTTSLSYLSLFGTALRAGRRASKPARRALAGSAARETPDPGNAGGEAMSAGRVGGGPPLSVVIPTHETRELTLACLASLARQEVPGIELIVVDDASTDGTAEAVVRRHPTVRLLRTGERAVGFTKAANLGLEAAGGELLLLLNSDTEVDPGSLAALLAAFAADPRLGAAGGALRYPDGRPQWSGGPAPTLPWLFGLASGLPALLGRLPLYRRLRPPAGTGPSGVDWVTGAAMGLRRTALDSLAPPPPLDPAFRFYAQDLDLCLRLSAAGWRVAVVPGFRVLHHHGATIGKRSDGGRQHPELLWADLLDWAAKHRGEAWAARATRAITAGACLRLLGRSLAATWKPREDRPAYARETAAYRQALQTVRRLLRAPLAKAPPLV